MKSLLDAWKDLAENIGEMCGISTARDFETVSCRVKNEGVSFLTITLPDFAKGLQKALEQGKADPDLWPFYRCRGMTPLFLGELMDRVFDRSSGVLLDEVSSDSIWGMRQLSLYMSKIEIPCSSEREIRAAEAYIQCEKEVKESDINRAPRDVADLRRLFVVLFGDVLTAMDRKVYDYELIPKHGPGATADRLRGNAKFDLREWTVRLEEQFPYGDYCLPNWRFNYRLDRIDFLEPGRERPVRVVFVPKTLKAPRVIAIEPTAMQYAQQAVSRTLVDLLETSWVSSMIGFTDQDPNRALAQEGSLSGNLATLDLSEASDRVSNQLVRSLLHGFPHLFGAVDSCRSRSADVPGHGVVRLAKFASMGSALTFPIEAMVFLTAVLLGIERSQGHRLSARAIRSFRTRVRVFGDDLIVPTEHADTVIMVLEALGLKVNRDKSFLRGKFRESCGREYYDGHEVSVVKVRRPFPSGQRTDAAEAVSAVSLRNNLYEAGLWKAAFRLDIELKRILRFYPYLDRTSAGLGRFSFLGYDREKECPRHHAPLVRANVVAPLAPNSPISGEGALLKCLLNEGEPLDRDHLRRTGRPEIVRTKLRWVRPY